MKNDGIYEAIGNARWEAAYLLGWVEAMEQNAATQDIIPRLAKVLDLIRTAHNQAVVA